MSIYTPRGNMKMVYTDRSTPDLHDKYYCARVSHHHYWFSTYSELLEFQSNVDFDPRMTFSNPATFQE